MLDEINQHQVNVARVSTSILKEDVYPAISGTYKEVRLIIERFGEVTTIRQMNELNKLIEEAIKNNLTDGLNLATEEMEELAVKEHDYTAELLAAFAATLGLDYSRQKLLTYRESQLKKQLRESIMSLTSGNKNQSAVWSKFITGYQSSVTEKYNSVIAKAYNDYVSSGKARSTASITKELRNINNSLLRREAETLIRTGVAHYTSKATQLVGQLNKDIIEREIPIVTFDSHTTVICMSISARYPNGWILGKSPIGYPPYHWGCRTVIWFLFKGQKELTGTREATGSDGEQEIKASKPMGKWLRTQSKEFVYKTLGKKKGEMFLAGKLPLADLTDEYLNPLTIKELFG